MSEYVIRLSNYLSHLLIMRRLAGIIYYMTERVSVFKTVQQGDVNSTTKCTVTVNDVSEKHEENLENSIYKYKTSVPVPPLGMVDDIANIARCGLDSALASAHLNAQTNHKNLQFGSSKCVNMHVGISSVVCPDNLKM